MYTFYESVSQFQSIDVETNLLPRKLEKLLGLSCLQLHDTMHILIYRQNMQHAAKLKSPLSFVLCGELNEILCIGVCFKCSSQDQAKQFEKRCEKKCCGLPLRLWRVQHVIPPIYDTPLRNQAVVLQILTVNPK